MKKFTISNKGIPDKINEVISSTFSIKGEYEIIVFHEGKEFDKATIDGVSDDIIEVLLSSTGRDTLVMSYLEAMVILSEGFIDIADTTFDRVLYGFDLDRDIKDDFFYSLEGDIDVDLSKYDEYSISLPFPSYS
jgi:hypothetical protein